eukprot:1683904-Prorocentrum_lima.AAC.1
MDSAVRSRGRQQQTNESTRQPIRPASFRCVHADLPSRRLGRAVAAAPAADQRVDERASLA